MAHRIDRYNNRIKELNHNQNKNKREEEMHRRIFIWLGVVYKSTRTEPLLNYIYTSSRLTNTLIHSIPCVII